MIYKLSRSLKLSVAAVLFQHRISIFKLRVAQCHFLFVSHILLFAYRVFVLFIFFQVFFFHNLALYSCILQFYDRAIIRFGHWYLLFTLQLRNFVVRILPFYFRARLCHTTFVKCLSILFVSCLFHLYSFFKLYFTLFLLATAIDYGQKVVVHICDICAC